jgi:hypothetical protein
LHDETDKTIGWRDITFKNSASLLGEKKWPHRNELSILKKLLDYKTNEKNYSDGIYAFYFNDDDATPPNSGRVPLKNYLKRNIVYCCGQQDDTTTHETTLVNLLYGSGPSEAEAVDHNNHNNYMFAYENVDAWNFPNLMLRTQPAARLDSAGQGAYKVGGTCVRHFIHDLPMPTMDLLHNGWNANRGALQNRRDAAAAAQAEGLENSIFSVDVKNLKQKTIDTIKKYYIKPKSTDNNVLHLSLDILNKILGSFSYDPRTNVLSFVPSGPGYQNIQFPFHITYNGLLHHLKIVNKKKYDGYEGRKQKKGGENGGEESDAKKKKAITSIGHIMRILSKDGTFRSQTDDNKTIIKDFILKILKYMGDESHSMNVDYIKEMTNDYNGGGITPIIFVRDQLLITRLMIREQCFIAESIDAFHHLPQYDNIIKSEVPAGKKVFILHNVTPPTSNAINEIIESVEEWEKENGSLSVYGLPPQTNTLEERKIWNKAFLENEYYQHIHNLIKYKKLIDDIVIKTYNDAPATAAATATAAVGGGDDDGATPPHDDDAASAAAPLPAPPAPPPAPPPAASAASAAASAAADPSTQPNQPMDTNGFVNINRKVINILNCFNKDSLECPTKSNLTDIFVSRAETRDDGAPPREDYIDFTDLIKKYMMSLYEGMIANPRRDQLSAPEAAALVVANQNLEETNQTLEKTNKILIDFVKLYNYLNKYNIELKQLQVFVNTHTADPTATKLSMWLTSNTKYYEIILTILRGTPRAQAHTWFDAQIVALASAATEATEAATATAAATEAATATAAATEAATAAGASAISADVDKLIMFLELLKKKILKLIMKQR